MISVNIDITSGISLPTVAVAIVCDKYGTSPHSSHPTLQPAILKILPTRRNLSLKAANFVFSAICKGYKFCGAPYIHETDGCLGDNSLTHS